MKNFPLWLLCNVAAIVPWAIIVRPLGVTAQALGLCVQAAGLVCLIAFRKKIWYS